MKFLFSIFFFLFTYFASANTTLTASLEKNNAITTVEFSDRGKKAQRKKARHGQKMNKKRKKACNNWGKRSFAG